MESVGGLDGNLAAVIGYLLPVLGLVFFIIDDNDFVRYHGLHSFLYGLVAAVVFPVSFTFGVGAGLVADGVLGTLMALFLFPILPLAIAVLPLYFLYNAYTGGTYAVFGLKQIVTAVV
jgi:uncharacterized membrane protein